MAGLVTGHYYEWDESYARIPAFIVGSGRRGIGRALNQGSGRHARKLGAGAVLLNSGTSRTGAHRFYEDSGYELNGYRFFKSLRPKES